MIIEFRVKNFRSIKEEAVFSFEANASNLKESNIALIQGKAEDYRLTKSVAIYGANASGKTNVILAFAAFLGLIKTSHRNELGKKIDCYQPFAFDLQTKDAPCEFLILFILDGKKYKYEIKFNTEEILEENLFEYNTKQETNLYKRERLDESIHTSVFGRSLAVEGVKKEVLKNQLFISKFNIETHSKLNPICAYFKTIDVERSQMQTQILNDKIAEEIVLDETSVLRKRLHKLMDTADIQIVDIKVEEVDEDDFVFPDKFPEEKKKKIIADNKWNIEFLHKNYDGEKQIDAVGIPLNEESLGTQILFGLGARILSKLENGGILIYDELDNSLHAHLSRLLVKIFNNPKSNPHNAQLIFTTHEMSIIDREMLRSDQIWFAEKNEFGSTELFSVQDFDGVREDAPFDKWYDAGRFGALPIIKSIDYIFEE
jgi:hypothetical protein